MVMDRIGPLLIVTDRSGPLLIANDKIGPSILLWIGVDPFQGYG